MRYVYASRNGNVALLVDRLHLSRPIYIDTGNEICNEDFILLTYTDDVGELPYEAENFLSINMSYIRGVIVSKKKNTASQAGDKIAAMFGVDCLYQVEEEGNEEDVIQIKKILEERKKSFWQKPKAIFC